MPPPAAADPWSLASSGVFQHQGWLVLSFYFVFGDFSHTAIPVAAKVPCG
jgi:hypothetical protein